MHVFKYWCKAGTCEMLLKHDINCSCYHSAKMYDKLFLNIYLTFSIPIDIIRYREITLIYTVEEEFLK